MDTPKQRTLASRRSGSYGGEGRFEEIAGKIRIRAKVSYIRNRKYGEEREGDQKSQQGGVKRKYRVSSWKSVVSERSKRENKN